MSQRRNSREVPCGNLLNADVGPPPSAPPPRQRRPRPPPRDEYPAQRPTRAFRDVQSGILLDFSGADDSYVPPTPPMPHPVRPTGPTTPMRYKPVPGKPGKMQPMFSREYYEDIKRRYPGQPLTWPEMSNMYEYPLGENKTMGPWLRDPLLRPGPRATGFEDRCGTDRRNPYGKQWVSPEWEEITSRPPANREQDRRTAARPRTDRQDQQNRGQRQ